MSGALIRYRIMAWVVGILLLLLSTIALPLKYIWGIETVGGVNTGILWMLHGWMFMIYLVTVLNLALLCRWSVWPRTLLVMLSGTIPFLSFYAEHKATGWAREAMAAKTPEPVG